MGLNMKIQVRKSNISGRGVFSLVAIKKGDIIETAPIILLSNKDSKEIDKTELYNYYFSWKKNNIGNEILVNYNINQVWFKE
jgi:SET domain-containing protein